MSEKVMGGVPPKPHTSYLSRYEIDEKVTLNFFDGSSIKDCIVDEVRFTKDKVRYNVLVPIQHGEGTQSYTMLENIDSILLRDSE